jgi:hypothetical protein
MDIIKITHKKCQLKEMDIASIYKGFTPVCAG